MKKTLAIIISVMMIITMMPTMAFATGTTPEPAPETSTPAVTNVYIDANSSVGSPDGTKEKPFTTMADALSAVPENGTITLLSDIDVNVTTNIGKNITLDLGQKKFNCTRPSEKGEDHAIIIESGKSLVLKNGVLAYSLGRGVKALGNATFTMTNDCVIDTLGSAVETREGNSTLNISGEIKTGDIGVWLNGPKNKANIDGAKITSAYFGVYQNGSFGGATVDIKNTVVKDTRAKGAGVYISNSKGNADNPEQGFSSVTIDNSDITGATGVEVKYTHVTVKNSNLTATTQPAEFIYNNNGSTTVGCALIATDNTTKGLPKPEGNIIINGGKYDGLVGLKQHKQFADSKELVDANYTFNSGIFKQYPDKYITDTAARKFCRQDGFFALGTDANKPANSNGMNTWTWNEKTMQYEESYVAPSVPSGPAPEQKPEVAPPTVGNTGNIETTVKPDASGKVETTVPSETITESLDKVTQTPSATAKPEVEIVVKEEAGATAPAKTVDVKVPAEAVEKIAKTEDATLKVTTSVGTVKLDNKALNKVVAEAKGEAVTITVEKQDVKEIVNPAQKETIETLGKDDHVFELTVKVGERVIHQLGGEATFEIHYVLKKGELAENVKVFYIDNEGKKHSVESKYNEKTQKIVMTTDHFSIFAVSYVDAPSKVKVLKAKSEKGKAALRWSRATNGAEGYRVYRAKAKDGKYTPIAWVKDGKAKTFKEKSKKTNKTYYYKVRAYKTVDGKKVWGEFSPVKKVKF